MNMEKLKNLVYDFILKVGVDNIYTIIEFIIEAYKYFSML